ncbi:hypothetical protein [Dyadobacter chenwenxiniae]|nr:hypothetical protein [Dyadobacter chenwenxiniae]
MNKNGEIIIIEDDEDDQAGYSGPKRATNSVELEPAFRANRAT